MLLPMNILRPGIRTGLSYASLEVPAGCIGVTWVLESTFMAEFLKGENLMEFSLKNCVELSPQLGKLFAGFNGGPKVLRKLYDFQRLRSWISIRVLEELKEMYVYLNLKLSRTCRKPW
jgi:hypothetical protein